MATQQFQTTAARRGGLLTFSLEVIVIDDDGTPVVGESGEFVTDEVEFRVNPLLDIGTLSATFATLAEVSVDLGGGSDDVGEDDDGDGRSLSESAEILLQMSDLKASAAEAVGECLVPADREPFGLVVEQLDVRTLMAIVGWLVPAVTGQDPTVPASA